MSISRNGRHGYRSGISKSKQAVSNSFLSQNFLTSRRTVARIIDLAHINAKDRVIEIGPGKGHITRALSKRCGFLTAVEIDACLYHKLTAQFQDTSNVRIICNDFLQMPLPSRGAYIIFANIPFSITTRIVRKITDAVNPPTDAWLVMEKGAAKRFMGVPRENAVSLALKPFFELTVAYHFKREDFHPAPAVDTVLLRIHRKTQPEIPYVLRSRSDSFLQMNLTRPDGWRIALTRGQAKDALRRESLPPIEPGGEILYVQWLCLFRRTLQNR